MSTSTTTRSDDATDQRASTPPRWWLFALVAAMSAWPFLSLVAANVDQPLDLGAIVGWFAVTAVAGAALVAVAGRRGHRAASRAATTWVAVVWLLFSHDLVARVAAGLGWSGASDLGWSLVAVPVLVLVVVLSRATPTRRFAGIAASLLFLASAGQVVLALVTSEPEAEAAPPAVQDGSFVRRPNVWYIALDGAASNGFLRERTGYDPVAFEAAMADRGLELQQDATSNYPFTNLSMASTLEMTYLFDGVKEPKGDPYFQRMAGDNAVVELMRANGYAYAHNYPGIYSGSRCGGTEDLCLGGEGSLTETELALSSMVPFGDQLVTRSRHEDVAVTNDPAHAVERILAADLPEPSYNFVHVLNPHAPLLRDADCDVREGIPLEFSHWGLGPEYADAVRCLHDQLIRAVDHILDDDPDALIVIQSDHGPRFGVDWAGNPDGILFDEDMHFSILSAIRLPEECADITIPSDLVPVNTFRLVRACLEGTEPDLLPNRRFPILARRKV